MKRFGFTKGLLLGGIVGAAAALIKAPKKGTELQKDVHDTFEELVQRGKKVQRVAKRSAQRTKKKASRTTKEIRRDLQKAEKEVLREIRSGGKKVKKAATKKTKRRKTTRRRS